MKDKCSNHNVKLKRSTVKKRILQPDSGGIVRSILIDLPSLVCPVSEPDIRLKRQCDVRLGTTNGRGALSVEKSQPIRACGIGEVADTGS